LIFFTATARLAGELKLQVVVHVQLEAAIEVQVGPEESTQTTPVLVGQLLPSLGVPQDDLDHDRVEVGDRRLSEVEGERGHLHVLFVVACEVAGLAGVRRLSGRGIALRTGAAGQ
jgi:hypothetical protein